MSVDDSAGNRSPSGLATDDTACVVSVIVAVKNALPQVRDGLRDWRKHLPRRAELLLVDGGSTDGSREWLRTEANEAGAGEVTLLERDDGSIAEAWNYGVGVARGAWVVFMGADDRMPDGPGWERVCDRLTSLADDVDACLFAVEIVAPSGAALDVVRPRLAGRPGLSSGIRCFPHQGVFHRRSLWGRVGPFDETFAVAADYELLVRAQCRGARIVVCDTTGPVQMTFGGLSTRSPLRTLAEYRRAHRMHGITGSRVAWARLWAAAAARAAVVAVLGRPVGDRLSDLMRTLLGRPRVWTAR